MEKWPATLLLGGDSSRDFEDYFKKKKVINGNDWTTVTAMSERVEKALDDSKILLFSFLHLAIVFMGHINDVAMLFDPLE